MMMVLLMNVLLPLRKFKLSRSRRPSWLTACEGFRERSCDLTRFHLHHLGLYRLQVRASSNGQHSDWTSRDFCPDQDGERDRDTGSVRSHVTSSTI